MPAASIDLYSGKPLEVGRIFRVHGTKIQHIEASKYNDSRIDIEIVLVTE